MTSIQAAVLRGPGRPLRIERLELEDPCPDEVLVRLVASGICHTDIDYCERGAGGAVVLGHEGSGVIERTGRAVRGHFFGQSSFATCALATARNTVKVPKSFSLELLAPLGCGLQTGAGTVMNSLAVKAGSSIAIFIPKLIRLYSKGLFPFDRLVRFYEFGEINRAIADSQGGNTIKPVLRIWSEPTKTTRAP